MSGTLQNILAKRKLLISATIVAVVVILGALIVVGRSDKPAQTAFTDVSNALVQYRRVREIRTQQELLVGSLQDASRLAHLRYEGRVDTLLNALVADTSLFSAELSLAQTKRNELLSLVQLYKALGGGWQQ